jgi:RimJ/RimL family protein N-acetyltransferase
LSGEQQGDVELRPWSATDLSLLERLLGDPAMTEHLGGPESPERIRGRHERYCRIPDTGAGRIFVIVVWPARIPAGSVGYWEREWRGQNVWETGWSVLPDFQGQGIVTRGTAAALFWARGEGKHRFMHAFSSIENSPANGICRKLGFTFQGEFDFEYPPGNPMRCKDWRLDLFASISTDPV